MKKIESKVELYRFENHLMKNKLKDLEDRVSRLEEKMNKLETRLWGNNPKHIN